MKHYFHCIKCNKDYKTLSAACQHDKYYNYLEILYDYKEISKNIDLRKITPLEKNRLITLGECNTPLIKMKGYSEACKDNDIYIKNEAQNPTGSFKDRETALVISHAKEQGVKKVVIASSGNAALSAAAYAKKAKIACECFIPKDTSKSKILILKIYNTLINTENGDYEKIYRDLSDKNISDAVNITSGQNCYREEGSKMVAFEIWEKISVPDIIIVPVGNGTLLSAIYKGFFELKKLGLTNKLPKLYGVQVKNCSPLKKALDKNIDFKVLNDIPESIAEGIVAKESYDAPKAIRAIKATDGKVIEVSDEETRKALIKVIKNESIIPEPTSAVVFAALDKIKIGKKKSKIVCILTGNGNKNLAEILELIN